MVHASTHRGPDGEGWYDVSNGNKPCWFGHNRLSILDTSENAAQPFRNELYSLIYNGEISVEEREAVKAYLEKKWDPVPLIGVFL